MKPRRVWKLTVETERTFIFRTRRARSRWCDQCEIEVDLLSVADAALEAGRSELLIYQLIQAGDLHFVEDDGQNLVCSSSLRRIQHALDHDGNPHKREGADHET